MKRKLFVFSFLAIFALFISGCETNPPLDQIQDITSIVGKIDSFGSKIANFKVKAYAENDSEFLVAEVAANQDGYFQLIVDEGSYILKIDYIFNENIMGGEAYKENKEKLGSVKVEDGKLTNVGLILFNAEKIINISLPGNNSPNYSSVQFSDENFAYYFDHPGYKVIAQAESTKASSTGLSQFSVSKEGTILLFDIPEEAAVIMDFVSRGTTFFYTPTCVYELKGAQYINLKLGSYVFAVTSSTFPADLQNPWKFWVLEPLY